MKRIVIEASKWNKLLGVGSLLVSLRTELIEAILI